MGTSNAPTATRTLIRHDLGGVKGELLLVCAPGFSVG